jgi:signal transduction histidine kinase
MQTWNPPPDAVSLDSVLTTAELRRRPSRPANYQAENQALVGLMQELVNSPSSVLQKLVDTALELCGAHSAGISLVEEEAGQKIFRWHAIAGRWAPFVWGTTPREYSPCGTVLDYNCTLLFSKAHRYYSQFAAVEPLLIEALLVPFYVGGVAVGTIWVVAHDETRLFDAEDQRTLENLGKFAAMAYQSRLSMADLAKTNNELRVEIAERQRSDKALREGEEALRQQAKDLEQQLIASGRLVSLGEVTASMAHEFNNPLGIILGFVEDILKTLDISDPNYRFLQIVNAEANRCRTIVNDLMEFGRPMTTSFASVSIPDMAQKALSLVENRLYKQKVQSELEFQNQLPKIHADAQQLEQVLVNLYLNAIDAMPKGGMLMVEGRFIQHDGKRSEILITVTDTGHGISDMDLQKIFQPFFTAKKGRGMGLGLPICQRIIQNHGGRIEVESQLDKGSTFKIYLPSEYEQNSALIATSPGTHD